MARCRQCGRPMTQRKFKDGNTYYVCMDCKIKGARVLDDDDFEEEAPPTRSVATRKRTLPPAARVRRTIEEPEPVPEKTKKKKPGVLKIIGIVIGALVLLGIIGQACSSGSGSSSEPSSSVASNTTAEQSASTESATQSTTISEENAREVVLSALRLAMSSSFEDRYTVSIDGNMISITVWGDGVAIGSVAAVTDETAYQAWVVMRESLQAMAQSNYELANSLGYQYNVAVYVLNDLNKENVLLTYLNGIILSDCVEEARAQ